MDIEVKRTFSTSTLVSFWYTASLAAEHKLSLTQIMTEFKV